MTWLVMTFMIDISLMSLSFMNDLMTILVTMIGTRVISNHNLPNITVCILKKIEKARL